MIAGGLASAGALAVGGCPAGDNSVGHDLDVSGNANAISVIGNTVDHDLRITDNTNTVTVADNSVGHDTRVDEPGPSHFAGTAPPAQPAMRPAKPKPPKAHGRRAKPTK